MAAQIKTVVQDSSGRFYFDPASCAHTYTLNVDSTVASDTAFDPVQNQSFVKTYTYTAGHLTAESAWVVDSTL